MRRYTNTICKSIKVLFFTGIFMLIASSASANNIMIVDGPAGVAGDYGGVLISNQTAINSFTSGVGTMSICAHTNYGSSSGPVGVYVANSNGTGQYTVGWTTFEIGPTPGQYCWTQSFSANNGGVISGNVYGVVLSFFGGNGGNTLSIEEGDYVRIYDEGGYVPPIVDTSTRFIEVYPDNGATTATTSKTGAKVYIAPDTFLEYGRLHAHFIQDSSFACMNSGAVYDAVYTCAGENAPAPPIDIDLSTTTLNRLLTGEYDLFNDVTFGGGGKWNGTYEIQEVSYPWYYLGLVASYKTILSTTTQFTIGQPSPMDIIREDVASSTGAINKLTQQGIGAILASTTASFKNACTPFSSGFDAGDCIALAIWPGQQAIADDFDILKQLPPWGYVFRFIDLLSATSSTTTLPTVTYTLSTSSPFYPVMTEISFDPLGTIRDSGDFVKTIVSDQATPKSLWQIVMPGVDIIVYMTLIFMIIKDLTNIHKHDTGGSKHKDRNKQI